MKRKIIGVGCIVVLALSLSLVVYAAGSFTMTYLPGTGDAVTNMPADDSGTGGQTYSVSSTVPQRAGYEFLSWTLDYDIEKTYTLTYRVTGDPTYGKPADAAEPSPVTDIPEGSSVTLASAPATAWTTADGTPYPTESYVVNYWLLGSDEPICDPKVVTDQIVGSTVTEAARCIDGFVLAGSDTQQLTIQPGMIGRWNFTGWCSDEACNVPITEVTNISADTTVYGQWEFEWITGAMNEIIFYYEELSMPMYSYRIQYIDISGVPIAEEKVVTDIESGTHVIELALDIPGYTPIANVFEWDVVEDGQVLIFVYFPYSPILS